MPILKNPGQDSWLTREDLWWRPKPLETSFTWSDLNRLRKQVLEVYELQRDPWAEIEAIDKKTARFVQSPVGSLPWATASTGNSPDNVLRQKLMNELDAIFKTQQGAEKRLMHACYSEFGRVAKPKSVVVCERAREYGLPSAVPTHVGVNLPDRVGCRRWYGCPHARGQNH